MAVYTKIVSFIKSKEGGLSSATTDTASNNPSNCGNGSNGKPYHTNKGITWSTFKGLSSKLGYSATCDNFLKMPDSIWSKIYKDGYWNPIQGDRIQNQAIANSFVEMAWGSGVGSNTSTRGAIAYLKNFFKSKYNKSFDTITQIVDYVNELDNSGQTPQLFEKLYDFRKSLYTSFNQPSNLKGWINRLDAFYLLNKPYATSTKTKASIAVGVLLIIAGATLYYKYGRTK
jgi:lysozyme family protein